MQAIITNALYRNTEINGTYTLIEKVWNSSDAAPKNGRMKIMLDGAVRTIRVNKEDVQYVDEADASQTAIPALAPVIEAETEEQIAQRITEAFEAMDIFTIGAIAGHVKSLIISGAAGVGKTFTLERELNKAQERGDINFKKVAGTCSGIGLFTKLWECRNPGDVLLLDDVDVFKDEDQLNLLKAALDTGEERWVSWMKASSYLEEQGIDQEFLFEGTVIFISNKDFDRELDANTKLSPHFSALISRSIYLDLGVHTKEEIMVRIKQVVTATTMLEDLGLNGEQIAEMLVWIEKHMLELRTLSLRTCLHIADMMLTSPTKWEMLAKMTMLSKKRK
ncbi:thioredoxin [Vibrio phage TCU_VP02_YC]|uniref:Thioredoxin n=1 Tax=Vibrio phage phi-pp2 TaxID=1204514 RepID=I6X2P4_9CAUD|nr:thioredoxin [Vibrio phage phi-pp2]